MSRGRGVVTASRGRGAGRGGGGGGGGAGRGGGGSGGVAGAGRGRGGKSSVFTPDLLGGLYYGDIIEASKQGTDVLYPPMNIPDTDYPTEREAEIAKKYNSMVAEMKFTPYMINAPTSSSHDIERYSDRFKRSRTAERPEDALQAVKHRRYENNKELFPASAVEYIFENKRLHASKSSAGLRSSVVRNILGGDDDPTLDAAKAAGSGSEIEEEEEDIALDEEDEYEDENDYGDNYFDNGEDDDNDGGGDALGGGGDEDGGVFD